MMTLGLSPDDEQYYADGGNDEDGAGDDDNDGGDDEDVGDDDDHYMMTGGLAAWLVIPWVPLWT